MNNSKYRYQMYRQLEDNREAILKEAVKAAEKIGIPQELKGKFGLSGSLSGCHALITDSVSEAMDDVARKVIANKYLDEQVREIVKDVYGDDYDGAMINTCEAALWVVYDIVATPPMLGRGMNYRSRYLTPYERHMHHQAGYGRPFPSRYKDLYADRGVTTGELGIYGKRLENLDVVIVPLAGARYECHGLRYHPAPLLLDVDPDESIQQIREVAKNHSSLLTACASLAYDSPGYGYGVKDSNGAPKLQRLLGDFAREQHITYVADNAWGLPFVGTDPRKIGADVMVYSMDKAAGGPTSGLIIGKEDIMVDVRRALGVHGERWGSGLSHGKAAYVTADPGKEALAGGIAALKILRDQPGLVTDPLDRLYDIVNEEFSTLNPSLKNGLVISKSYNSGMVEINYQNTWKNGEMGIPIFTIEDMYAGSELIQRSLDAMGIIPPVSYDANICISLGLGTSDEKGQIIEEPVRYMLKGLIAVLEIVSKYAGVIEEAVPGRVL